jgi:glycerophosphoryl diester phosphodiesterase
MTSDGQIVVIHDADAQRVAGSPLRIADTPWSALKELDCGRWKGTQWSGERLPLLADVIDGVPAGKRLYIEPKCGIEILPALSAELAGAGRATWDLVVICFDEAVVAGIKDQMPDVPAFLLSQTPQPAMATSKGVDLGPNWLEELIAIALRAGADGLGLEAGPAVDGALVRRAVESGLPCHVWTVDNAHEARRLRDAGVVGITTNRPAWLRVQLAKA